MRDQDIRDILYNAEEPVSPGVWSAVAAGLDAKKRIVPAWMWGAMAFAAAAAVAVGVFLWRPNQGYRLEEFTPASPLAARLDNSLSGGIVTPQSASQAPVRKSAAPVALREEASLNCWLLEADVWLRVSGIRFLESDFLPPNLFPANRSPLPVKNLCVLDYVGLQ